MSMSIDYTKRKLTKMSSEALLRKVASGTMNKQDAKIAATILESRFPTPKNK
jgi:hypothetical protein